uniref:Uncharacterized protein n=1 Tax=Rhizophora mucronata TaxID=61149 RepID=A0A2P2P412_RHIMU
MLPRQSLSENSNSLAGNEASICLEGAKLALSLSYFYLTFNTITTVYRAYISSDLSMVAFVVSAYAAYFCLDLCLTQLSRMSPHKASPRKTFLKIVIWGLSSALFFGFAYQFSTFLSRPLSAAMYAIAIAASAFLFYFYFVFDDKCGSSSSNVDTVKFFGSACHPKAEDFNNEFSKQAIDIV